MIPPNLPGTFYYKSNGRVADISYYLYAVMVPHDSKDKKLRARRLVPIKANIQVDRPYPSD